MSHLLLRSHAAALSLAIALSLAPSFAHAAVHAGDVAPPFTKNELVSTPFPQAGPARSLSDYVGHVLVIHLIGWN